MPVAIGCSSATTACPSPAHRRRCWTSPPPCPSPTCDGPFAEADYRGLLDPAAIDRLTGRGRPGSAALGRALSLHLPRLAQTRSLLERRFLLLVERAGLPLPKVNAIIEGLMVDALWREAGVVVELDGHRAHARAAAAERDRSRELALRAAGFTVLRYTWQQVSGEPAAVIADLRAALERLPD
jgi:very-short-patch-repair endonuclease